MNLEEGHPFPRWLSTFSVSAIFDLEALRLPSDRTIYASDILHNQTYFDLLYEARFYEKLVDNFKIVYGAQSLYDVSRIPSRRTTAGCDTAQLTEDPEKKKKVFIFAYDWRRSNVETAVALKDYVGCVKLFHPNRKIDILAHSMGGLVARRYVLDFPADHQIEKVITIGTPWLGAPRAIHSLETGAFIAPAFGGYGPEWAANMAIAGKLKSVMETFPGPLQLLPSQYYFDLNYSDINSQTFPTPLAIKKFPWSQTQDFNFSQMAGWLNTRYPINPGNIVNSFHNIQYRGLQDDWRQDESYVNYYHIYGRQRSNLTVGKVVVRQSPKCFRTTIQPLNLNCNNSIYYEPIPTTGDGTVPVLSSRRISHSQNINSNKARRYLVDAKTDPQITDAFAEHTKMTEETRVQATLNKIIRNVDSDQVLPEDGVNVLSRGGNHEGEGTLENKSNYVSLRNVQGFHATNEPQPTFSSTSGANGMQAVPMGEKSAWIAMPDTDNYKVKFFGDGTPLSVRIINGYDYDRIERQTVYNDLIIPSEAIAELSVSPYNEPVLRYDSDNDGFPDQIVDPTYSITGQNAKDIEAPVLTFESQNAGSGKITTLAASDDLSGVKNIYYSLDGSQFYPYLNPIATDSTQDKIYVFVEDNVGNRTGIAPLDIIGKSYSIGNRVWFDTNNNGKIDREGGLRERGAGGVSVSLFVDGDADGLPDNINAPLKSTSSDGDGYYRFDDLLTGNYIVRIDPQNFSNAGVLVGFKNSTVQVSANTDSDTVNAGENGILPNGSANIVQNTGVLSNTIEIGSGLGLSEPVNETDSSPDDRSFIDGYSNLTVDFGFYQQGISGTVWSDSGAGNNANNGVYDLGENPLQGYLVKLFSSDGQEVPVGLDGILGTDDDGVSGLLTDIEGTYAFRGLNDGFYTVKVLRNGTVSSSVMSTTPNDNIDNDNNGVLGTGSDIDYVVSYPLNLISGQLGALENNIVNEFEGTTIDETLDLGLTFSPTAGFVTLSGRVLQTNGSGLANIKVSILDVGTLENREVTTNPFGYFSFTNVVSGKSYVVSATHKNYSFSPKSIFVTEDMTNLEFVPNQ